MAVVAVAWLVFAGCLRAAVPGLDLFVAAAGQPASAAGRPESAVAAQMAFAG